MEGSVLQRSATLAAVAAPPTALRDLLKLRDEDDRAAVVTLASAAERQASLPAPSSAAATRTLLDVICNDQPPSGVGDRLVPLSATGSTTIAEAAAPAPRPPSQLQLTPPPPADEEEDHGETISLMALLEQTDRQWNTGSAAEAQALVVEVDDDAGKGAVPGWCCCVCMARAKGAAFIPCGHTFCRACARELLAGRGRCPLCNTAIVDVLDIF